jgi:hypothetical protein
LLGLNLCGTSHVFAVWALLIVACGEVGVASLGRSDNYGANVQHRQYFLLNGVHDVSFCLPSQVGNSILLNW